LSLTAELPVLIVGQGLAGTCLAAELESEGQTFHIINLTSANSASRVAAGVWNPVVLKRFVPAWMADDALAKIQQFYPFWEAKLNTQFFYRKPLHKVLSNEEELNQCQLRFESEKLERFSKLELDNEAPKGIYAPTGNLCVAQAGYLDVPVFLDAMQGYFKSMNSYQEDAFNYEDLTKKDGKWEYQKQQFSQVVFAEGARATNNPYLKDLKFRNTKGEILKVRLPKVETEEAWNKQIFMMPLGRQEYKVGATYSWKSLDHESTQKALEELTIKLEVIADITDLEVLEHRAGIRPTMPDRRPVLGQLPQLENAFVFNGLGSRGVMLAPLMARILVASLKGNSSIPFDAQLQRFKAFKGQD